MTLTARELVHRIAEDSGLSYREIVHRLNSRMAQGHGLLVSVHSVAEECGLDPDKYTLNPLRIVDRIREILNADHARTLMISAVLAQMIESPDGSTLPLPAFFAFVDILSGLEGQACLRRTPPTNVEEATTEVIELCTTLVSLICDWSSTGVAGVSRDCPDELRELAKTVLRKTRMYQAGLWTCLSCGRITSLKESRSVLCPGCADEEFQGDSPPTDEMSEGRHRTGYGQFLSSDE